MRQVHPIQEFLGVRYYRKPTGYYKCDFKKHGGRYMHRVVWEHYRGPIPEDHEVHHLDHDPANNDISNLECVPAVRHRTYHGMLNGSDASHMARIRVFAAKWHGSQVGREWHVEHAKRVAASLPLETHRCAWCDKEYEAKKGARKRGFCSMSCQGMARKASGVDDEDRVCIECNAGFRANKYSRVICCSRRCAGTVAARRRAARL